MKAAVLCTNTKRILYGLGVIATGLALILIAGGIMYGIAHIFYVFFGPEGAIGSILFMLLAMMTAAWLSIMWDGLKCKFPLKDCYGNRIDR